MSYWWLEHSNFLCVFLQGSRQPRRSSISKRDIPWSSYWRWRRQRLVRRTKAGWLGPADYVISYTLLRRKVSRLSIVFLLHVFVIFFYCRHFEMIQNDLILFMKCVWSFFLKPKSRLFIDFIQNDAHAFPNFCMHIFVSDSIIEKISVLVCFVEGEV